MENVGCVGVDSRVVERGQAKAVLRMIDCLGGLCPVPTCLKVPSVVRIVSRCNSRAVLPERSKWAYRRVRSGTEPSSRSCFELKVDRIMLLLRVVMLISHGRDGLEGHIGSDDGLPLHFQAAFIQTPAPVRRHHLHAAILLPCTEYTTGHRDAHQRQGLRG